jgi:hypothetical protein
MKRKSILPLVSLLLSILGLLLIVTSSRVGSETIWPQKLTSSEVRLSTVCLKSGLLALSVSMGLLSLHGFRNKREWTHNQ